MKTLRHVLSKIEDPQLSDQDGSKLLKIIFTELFKALDVDLDKEIFKKSNNRKKYRNRIDNPPET